MLPEKYFTCPLQIQRDWDEVYAEEKRMCTQSRPDLACGIV